MGFFGKKGSSGFSSSSTAEEVTEGIDGNGLTAIVTGMFFLALPVLRHLYAPFMLFFNFKSLVSVLCCNFVDQDKWQSQWPVVVGLLYAWIASNSDPLEISVVSFSH